MKKLSCHMPECARLSAVCPTPHGKGEPETFSYQIDLHRPKCGRTDICLGSIIPARRADDPNLSR